MLRKAQSLRCLLISGLASIVGVATAQAQTSAQAQSQPRTMEYRGEVRALQSMPGVAMVANNSVRFGGVNSSELPPVINAPFSAVGTTEEITKLIDGNRIVKKRVSNFYRDAKGRTRVETSLDQIPGGFRGFPVSTHLHDPLTGENYMLNVQNKQATAFPSAGPEPVIQAPVSAPPVRWQLSVAYSTFGFGGFGGLAESGNTKSLGEKSIGGIRAVGTRTEYVVAKNTIGNVKPIKLIADQWFSPELGVILSSTQTSSAGFENIYKLEQINQTEPDAELFTVPADFKKESIRSGNGVLFQSMKPITSSDSSDSDPPPPPQN